MGKLSVIVPAFNEEPTVKLILKKLSQVLLVQDTSMEIIVVNDASTDETAHITTSFIKNNPELEIVLVNHEKNKGKGAAIHTGIKK